MMDKTTRTYPALFMCDDKADEFVAKFAHLRTKKGDEVYVGQWDEKGDVLVKMYRDRYVELVPERLGRGIKRKLRKILQMLLDNEICYIVAEPLEEPFGDEYSNLLRWTEGRNNDDE